LSLQTKFLKDWRITLRVEICTIYVNCAGNEYRKQHSRMGLLPLHLGIKNINFDP
jgi:hypothetical protein